jgi:AraC-like DNA-binding protein
MMNEYFLFFAVGGFWTTLVLAMVFLFGGRIWNVKLRKYYRARNVMGFAYILFASIILFELTTRFLGFHHASFKTSILIFSTFQLLIFTHVNITLINIKFLSIRKLIYHLLPVTILGILSILSHNLKWGFMITSIIYYSLLLLYIASVVIFGFIFTKHYKRYKKRFDNYFTENSANLLQWVYNSFLFILIASFVIIITTLIFSDAVKIFPILVIFYYTVYAIHFLNYKQIYYLMEPVLNEEVTVEADKQIKPSFLPFKQIETVLKIWEEKKLFTSSRLTIAIVASQISTNRTYLSHYLNSTKNKTFSDWINELRIEEAKRMMEADQSLKFEEISEKVGYTDKSYFSKCFLKYTGITVTQWRKSQN